MKYLVLLTGILLGGCDTGIDVKYSVTGSASKVDITYEAEGGSTQQANDAPIPWSYSFKAYSGDFVYVSAQNLDESGTITVTIYKNGSEFKTATSSGSYCIATASGSL